MVLIITNNNPYLSSAGVQKYIQVQDKALCENGTDSITIFPIVKKTRFCEIRLWGCVLRIGKKRSFIALNDKHLLLLVRNYTESITATFIHHLKDTNISTLTQILMICRGPVAFYVHDYFTCCTSINLLHNGSVFCGNSILSEDKCKSCVFYLKSLSNKMMIDVMLESVKSRLNVIAPSEVCAYYWSEAYPKFKCYVQVIGHQEYIGEYKENKDAIGEDEKIRVAFVGAGDTVKGIAYWKNAVEQIAKNDRIEFFHFGRSYWRSDFVKNISVSVNSNNPDAMVKALRNNNIHVTVLNSICPETYSFTYFEALASNCFVITNKNSGNIARQVEKNKNGMVLSNPEDLSMYLEKYEKLREDVNRFRLYGKCGPQETRPNNKSIFPFLLEKDDYSVNPSAVINRNFFERFVDYIYKKKYPISVMKN